MMGDLQPMKPEGWPVGKDMNDGGGGVIFHGTKDKLICGSYGNILGCFREDSHGCPGTSRNTNIA